MAGLHLYRSNRLEILADALAEIARKPLRSAFEDEIVIVQSLGMRRWLSLQLAERHGITMHWSFMFPARFVQRIFVAALGSNAQDRAFDRDLLPWRILALFPSVLEQPDFRELADYVGGEMRPLKEFQLAQKIAEVFDRYLAYRPEMLVQWQQGAEAGWQAELWRALVRGHESGHAPTLARQFGDALERGKIVLSRLPERVSILGISSLPPFYIQLLGQIATCLDVHLFQLEPTDLYWGDIASLKEQERIARLHKKRGRTPHALHYETGHSLLASMARVGREFSNLLLDLNPVDDAELFEPPMGSTLLTHLQANIFHLHERPSAEKISIAAADRSVQVHCCHSPMRELEVLHDQLLAMFQADSSLTPKDILVSMPDIERYAPFIEAIFGAPEDPALTIPFTIADRSARAESCVAGTFLQLLDLAGSRFGIAAVLTLLETRPVRRRFELAESDLKTIRRWIERTGIRWGVDAEHRAELGLPAFTQNTWRAGLQRLLLGYALPGDGETLFDGLLPFREVEGDLALTLGRFVDFVESLFASVRGFRGARALREWEQTFREVLHTFFDENDESADEIRRLRSVLESLGGTQRDAGLEAPVAFEVVRAHLAQALVETDAGVGFMAGRVTFSALKPMRSIPFKVICLLGMNDTALPRRDATLAFDLTALRRRAGDRSLRDDDRQLFLETLLSARDVLYISYCGASEKDNSESPPSVLVNELLDYLETNVRFAQGDSPVSSLISRHPLQAFSPQYFGSDAHLFSFSRENCRASMRGRGTRSTAPDFIAGPLPPPTAEWFEVDLRRFAEFFCNPSKFFVRHRLGIRLPEETALLEDREPLALDPLSRVRLQDRLAQRGLVHGDLEPGRGVFRAGGDLPAGYAGDASFCALREEVEAYLERVREVVAARPLEPLALDFRLGDWHLTGTLGDIQPQARVCRRASAVTAGDQLRAWISHLVLNCVAPMGYPRETLLVGTDATHRFVPAAHAETLLRQLLEQYRAGLCEPLRFFPRSSYEFARRSLRPGPRETSDPLWAARGIWLMGDSPESREVHHALCHRRPEESLDRAWEQLALAIFGPLLSTSRRENFRVF